MPTTCRHLIVLGLVAGCFGAVTASVAADGPAMPQELKVLFARYDREPDGLAKAELAAQIDAVAHQKYATVSRLYWHTDLASARIAARVHGRPILHLRMLGRLDEDLSCANSRLFRATLYANQNVSAFLRERFILHWSSERPVPRVTIDFGDGRKLEWTTTGNSAHYVLDELGNVLDVLPGLYAPTAFRSELEGSLALAARVRGTSDEERAKLLVDYHQQRLVAAGRDWERIAATPGILGAARWGTPLRVRSDFAAAQRATTSKMSVEGRQARYFAKQLAPEEVSEDQIETWSAVGQVLYGIGAKKSAARPQFRASLVGELPVEPSHFAPPPAVLDEASRTLIVRLHDAVPRELRATDQQRDAMIARLEQTIAADSAFNQLRLRPQIGREIVRRGGRGDFATLNAWIYAKVFRTPKQDAWLGLLPRDVFTGLPGDGVVMR
jgi:hypothetical protein